MLSCVMHQLGSPASSRAQLEPRFLAPRCPDPKQARPGGPGPWCVLENELTQVQRFSAGPSKDSGGGGPLFAGKSQELTDLKLQPDSSCSFRGPAKPRSVLPLANRNYSGPFQQQTAEQTSLPKVTFGACRRASC